MAPPWLTDLQWVGWQVEQWWATALYLVAGLFVCGLFIRLAAWHHGRQQEVISFGSARFATARETAQAGLLQGAGVILAKHAGTYLRATGDRHVLLVGPSRSWKDVGVVIPTLLSWPYSALILDVKGETLPVTAGYRAQLGSVYRFNPLLPGTTRMNVLRGIRWERDEMVADVQRVSNSLAASADLEEAVPTKATEYWRGQGTDLLNAGVLDVGSRLPNHGSLGAVRHLLIDAPIKHTLQAWERSSIPLVREQASRMMKMAVGRRAEVWDAATRLLSPWQDPLVCAATDASDVDIMQMQQGVQPVTLYLQVSPEDLQGRLRPLFRLLWDHWLARLTDRPAGNYRWPLLLVFNEFAAMGRLQPIERALALVGEYGITCLLVLQSMQQLWESYGRYTGIFDNCAVRVFFRPNRLESAKELEGLLGQTTVEEELPGSSGHRLSLVWGRGMRRRQRHARALLTAGEILQLANDAALVCTGEVPPILAQKVRAYRDRPFRRRLALPFEEVLA